MWSLRSEQLKLLIQTPAGTSLNAAGAYIDVECDIAINQLAGDASWSLEADHRNSGPDGGVREAYFPAYELASVPAGGTIIVDFPVPGVVNNDLVESFDYTGNLGLLTVRNLESISGALRVILHNPTSAAIDLPPGDIRLVWRKSLTNG